MARRGRDGVAHAGHAGRRPDRSRAARPALRRPGLGEEPVVVRPPAELPAVGALDARARRRRPARRAGQDQGGLRGPRARGRPGPDQRPRRQPGGAAARHGDRRAQPPRRGGEHGPRRGDERRAPAAGRRVGLPRGREPRGDARQGRLPQPPHGAPAVRAADAHDVRDPAAAQPAVDQQVLRDGPRSGPQLRRVGGPARAHRVRDQLPQPGRDDARRRARRLPAPRPAHRARRDRRDHRLAAGQHRRAVPRRHADHHAAGPPRPSRRGPHPLGDAAQHPARLLRAGHAGLLHRRALRAAPRPQDGRDAACSRGATCR